MSFSPLVPFLLAACWILPAVIIAMTYRAQSATEVESVSESMNTSMKGLRADIAQLDYDARVQGWRQEDWGGPEEYVQARVTESSHEVLLLAPYAEASVSVTSETAETERRRCSLCLN